MTTARSVRFFVNLGLHTAWCHGPGFIMMICQLSAVLCHYSSVARLKATVLGGSISCLVTPMALDFGRVIYLT
jgi:hypothetical protein